MKLYLVAIEYGISSISLHRKDITVAANNTRKAVEEAEKFARRQGYIAPQIIQLEKKCDITVVQK